MPTLPRYIDPLSDFGFKHLFGREQSKPALVHFLNSLLPPERQVAGLDFIPAELLGGSPDDRTVAVDLHCRSPDGTTFIVEIQRRRQDHFRDRSLLYVARALSRNAMRGDWDYAFEPIILIAILDFVPLETAGDPKYIHEARLRTADGKTFSDTITIIHVELPKFGKAVTELATPLDHWLYLNQNLPTMTQVPEQFSHRVFTDWITEAEYAQLSYVDQFAYDRYWFARNDQINQDAYARREAIKEGLERGLEQGLERGLERGLEQGHKQGHKQGHEQGRRQGHERGLEEGFGLGEQSGQNRKQDSLIATLAKNGMTVDQIVAFTEIPEEEVRRVLEE